MYLSSSSEALILLIVANIEYRGPEIRRLARAFKTIKQGYIRYALHNFQHELLRKHIPPGRYIYILMDIDNSMQYASVTVLGHCA